MSQDVNELSKQPTPDKAEDNAFFPSPYSLSQYTAPKTDFDGVEHKGAYKDGKWKVLMIALLKRDMYYWKMEKCSLRVIILLKCYYLYII